MCLVFFFYSWGAGADIWRMGSASSENSTIPKQRINDNLVEVVGIYSSFHIGQMMMGLSEPYRFGQAKSVKIKLLDRLPIQVDGEPWLQHLHSTISINWHSQASMLTSNESNGVIEDLNI